MSENIFVIPTIISYWLVAGYLPGGVLAAILCWIFKKKNITMPRFRLWEWGVPFAAMTINLLFLLCDWGFYGKSLSNLCEGQITGLGWSLFIVLKIILPWRRSALVGNAVAFLTLLMSVLIGLFMPCLPE